MIVLFFFANRGAKLVVAFEPVPTLFEILNKNVALNGFEKVIHAKNEAVGDIFGIVKIGYNRTQPSASGKSLVDSVDALTFKVTSVPLSEIITGLGWVDILKIDCEGCEHKTLQHAGKTGALKHVGVIVTEVHSDVRNIVMLLKGEGFTVIKLTQKSKKLWILTAQRSS